MRVLLVLVLCLAFASCFGQQPSTPLDNLQGTEGVVVRVDAVPGFVYENEQFPVVFTLSNRGVANVSPDSPGRFFVSVDSLYLERDEYIAPGRFQDVEGGFFLSGRQPYVYGEDAVITQYLSARPISRQSERVSTPVSITACYPYATTLTSQVCVERSRVSDPGSVVCTNRPIRPPTQGAPVVVSEVETRSMPTPDGDVALTFRIVVRNVGGGVAATSGCFGDEINQDLNEVLLSARLLNEDLVCGSGDDPYTARLRFSRNEAIVVCRLPDEAGFASAQNNFLSLLTVDLDYSYRTSDRTEVTILRVQ